MSHIWSCGDENNDNQSGREWDTLVGTGAASVVSPLHGGGAFGQRAWKVNHAVNAITHQTHQFGATGNSGVLWFPATAVQWDTLPGAEVAFIQLLQAVVATIEVRLTTGGVVRLYKSDTGVQIGTDGPTISTGAYYWYTISYNGTTGETTLYVATTGGPLLAVATGTAATASSVRIRRGIITSTTGNVTFDDADVGNSSGTVNNTIQQERFIQAHRPNADGDINECSAGTFADVDEVTSDEATTRAILDANNDDFDVNIEAATVLAVGALNLRIPYVDVMIRERATSAASETWNARFKSQASGTVGTGPARSHNDTTFQTNGDAAPRIPYAAETDPQTAGLPISLAKIAGSQIGITATDATPDVEVTQMWANIPYEYMAVRVNPPQVVTPNALGMANDLLLKVA
jgi:hypothetical protein